MNYLDLFSGIGGFHKGLVQAGFSFEWVGYSEIDKYAKKVYQNHFQAEDLGDVRTITVDKFKRKINLITFGFPCQDLSIAGKRAGLAGKRSGLFSEAIRLVRDTRPDYFIFENVKGLFSSNQGRDFEYVLREIADIGYDGQWQLLNTRWVLPQNRERIYFVGYPRNRRRPEIFPIGEGLSKVKKSDSKTWARCIDPNYLERDFRVYEEETPCLSLRDYKEPKMIQVGIINKDAQGQRVYDTSGIACQLTSQGGGWGAKTGLYEVEACLTPNREKRQNGRQFKTNGEPMFTLTGQDIHGIAISHNHKTQIRRLTPLEAERLQGFPDKWTEGVSDSQRYKCLGNAVTVPIVKLIGEKILKH